MDVSAAHKIAMERQPKLVYKMTLEAKMPHIHFKILVSIFVSAYTLKGGKSFTFFANFEQI